MEMLFQDQKKPVNYLTQFTVARLASFESMYKQSAETQVILIQLLTDSKISQE